MFKAAEQISIAEFKTIKQEWDNLAQKSRLPTLTHDWMWAALESLTPEERPYLLTLRALNGELLAGACLVGAPSSKYLRFLGNYAVPEPSYIVARDLEAERRMIRAIRALGFPLNLDRVPLELCDLTKLGGAYGPAAFRFTRPEGGSPWLPLEGTWEDFENSLSAQRRSDLRRAYRKATSRGDISFDITEATPQTSHDLLQRYIMLERHSWKYAAGSAIELDKKAHRFFSALSCTSLTLRFGFMCIGDVTVAGQIMIAHADTVWVLKTAFHQTFRNCSPGVLLMHEAIRASFESRAHAFEFLGFEEPWLQVWTRGVREYQTIRVYSYTAQGASVLCREIWNSLKRRMRPTITVTAQA